MFIFQEYLLLHTRSMTQQSVIWAFEHFISSEQLYPSCQNYFHSPGVCSFWLVGWLVLFVWLFLMMKACHREKCLSSFYPSGLLILLTTIFTAAWQHLSTRSSPLFSSFLSFTKPSYQNALHNNIRVVVCHYLPQNKSSARWVRKLNFFPVMLDS